MASDGRWYPPELGPAPLAGSQSEPKPPSSDRNYGPWIFVLSTLAVLLIGLAVAIPLVAGESSTDQLVGPPVSEWPAKIAADVNLTSTDVPSGWRSNGEGGPCVASGLGSNPSAPYCGNGPLPGSNQQQNDETFARCLGLPVAQVSMFTGNDEPGEPPTYSSSTFSPSSGLSTSTTVDPPSAQMYVTVEPSAAIMRTDLDAVARPEFITCTQQWLHNSYALKMAQAIGSPAGQGGIHEAFSLAPATVATVRGISATAYRMTINTSVGGHSFEVDAESVVLGAGRVEAMLTLQSPAKYPPGATSSTLLLVEQRMVKTAAV